MASNIDVQHQAMVPSLKILSDLSKELGDCWDSLGIQLGVDGATIEAIRVDHVQYASPQKKAYAMLHNWYNKGKSSTYCELSAALRHESRQGLAEKYCEVVAGASLGVHVRGNSGVQRDGTILPAPSVDEIMRAVAAGYLRSSNPQNTEDYLKFLAFLQEFRKLIIDTEEVSSLHITVRCTRLKILDDLWQFYTSGALNEAAQKYLVKDEVLKKYDLKHFKLKTIIEEREYKRCKEELTEMEAFPAKMSDIAHAQDETPRMPRMTREDSSSGKLERRGYKFNKYGQLRNIKTGEPFIYEGEEHDEDFDEIIENYVYELLEEDAHLQRVFIPMDPKKDGRRSFFFMSPDALTNNKLMILINGSGKVKAGQWSRNIIINDSLDNGTMLPYIKKANEEGFGVLITNGNQGINTPEKHFKDVWNHFIKSGKAKLIVIVAHSYGGRVAVECMKAATDFMDRVKAVAFTNYSIYHLADQGVSEAQREWIKKHSRNWVTSSEPLDFPLMSGNICERVSAGTTDPRATSHAPFQSVFNFFEERLG